MKNELNDHLQDRSLCRMRYLHYLTLENTPSIKKLQTNTVEKI